MVGTKTPKHLREATLAALLVVLGSAASARAQLQHFNPGSLIIPVESPFQDPCGTVSAYGLVYKTLAASDALAALGNNRVTVHWVYNDLKASPNRCVPTNLHKTPQTPGACVPPYSDPKKCNPLPYKDLTWNDGCDFKVVSTAVAPVTQIDNTTGNDMTPAAGCGSKAGMFCTRNTNATTADANLSYPTFPSVIVQHSTTASLNVSAVQYMGGAFVIDATDAPLFLQLLSGKLSVSDTFGNPIDFSTFAKKSEIGGCSYSYDGTATVFNAGYANTHWVNIHKAAAGFDAPDLSKMSAPPGKIALLQTAGGKQGVGTNGVVGDMLPAYLQSAGLNFKSAQGCSPTGYNAKQPTPNANCPNGAKSGYIFDAFDVLDLQDPSTLNELNQKKPDGSYVYSNFWTPHWEGTTFTGCDGSCINKARQSIYNFTTTRKVGLLAECGSIGVIEGAQGANAFDPKAPNSIQGPPLGTGAAAAGWWYPPKQQIAGIYTDPALGFSSSSTNPGEPFQRLMTCVETTPGSGICSNVTGGTAGMRGTLHDIDPKGPTNFTSNYSVIGKSTLRNCTDPNLATGANCMHFPSPGSPYAQIGDYLWFSRYGLLSNFKPNTGSTYGSTVSSLGYTIAGVKNPGPGLEVDTKGARAQALADDFNLMSMPIKGSPSKLNASEIVYLGGHSYATDVSGTRVVLNTMLALGVVPDVHETAYVGATDYNSTAFVPTYNRMGLGGPSQWKAFTPSMADQWMFPYHTGDFRAHTVTALTSNALNQYADATLWDAASKLPAPGDRNIFTYLGGVVATDATKPNKVMQQGWKPVDIDWDSVDPSKAKCVDNLHIGEINSTTKPGYNGAPYAGMLPGKDGVCDLQEALQLTNISTWLTGDHGTAAGVQGGAIPIAFQNDLLNAQEVAQMVRGFCYATKADGTIQDHPTNILPNSQCNAVNDGFDRVQNDSAELGGFVHSQAAIVPPSPFIADAPAGFHRPVVAYVGGLDGMLHAFYVPSDGMDHGYTGPADAIRKTNPDASSAFHLVSTLTDSDGLKEMWAFVPPGQLPFIKSNNAVVDSSPVVIDAYGDFDGSGVRTWHTVLVASAGGGNREVFALDVTNPLKPILLWDLQGSFDDLNLQYAPSPLTDDDTGLDTTTQAQAFVWQNNCHSEAATCVPSDFKLPPMGKPMVTGLYNYGDLGASQSISIAQMRRFNAPVFAAFVATNEPQDQADKGSGLSAFAIDVTNGQKIWQFNNPYYVTQDSADARFTQSQASQGNTPPAGVTLFSKAGNSLIDTAYVGDDEGSLWELDAADGVNVNSFAPLLTGSSYTALCSDDRRCNFSLSQAYGYGGGAAQPISSLSTIFILPLVPASNALRPFAAQPMLAYATAGTDTVSGLEPIDGSGKLCPTGSPCINGALHLIPLRPNYHYTASDLLANATTVLPWIEQKGVGKVEPVGYPYFFAGGERIFGSIDAAGDGLFFNTSLGSASQIDQRGNLTGSTYRLLLSANSNPLYNYISSSGLSNVGAAGGSPMLDIATGNIVVITDKGILRFPPLGGGAGGGTGTLVGASVNGRGATPTGLLSWFFRRRGLEY